MGQWTDRRGAGAVLGLLLAVLLLLPTGAAHASPAAEGRATGPVRATAEPPAVDLRRDVRSPREDARGRRAYRRWPGRTIRFYSTLDKSFDWALSAAVGAWNRSGVDMRFKQVRSRKKARLLIRPMPGRGIFGEATLGYNPYGLRHNWIKMSRRALEPTPGMGTVSPWVNQVVTANILAHEMGHTLGIDHQAQSHKSCGLMMPTLMVGTCDVTGDQMGHYRCGMADAWVLKRAVRLYGGRKTPGTLFCPILPLPPHPADLRISGGIEEDRPVQVDWTPPSGLAPGTTMHIRQSSGSWCPARVGRDHYLWPAWADQTYAEFFVDPMAGTWHVPDEWRDDHEPTCYTARLVNEAGGSSATTSSLRIPWYPPPAAPVVTGVEQYGSYFYVSVDESAEQDFSVEHFVLVYPTGQCGTEPITLASLTGAPHLSFSTDVERPCLRVVAVRGQRVSAPTMWQVG